MASIRKILKRDASSVKPQDLPYEVHMGSIVHDELKPIYKETKDEKRPVQQSSK